jgi:hypothetical protein
MLSCGACRFDPVLPTGVAVASRAIIDYSEVLTHLLDYTSTIRHCKGDLQWRTFVLGFLKIHLWGT